MDSHVKPEGNWSLFESRPSWSVVSSPELAKVYGVSLQSVNNWKLRDKLPVPVKPLGKHERGNKNFYRISEVRARFEGRTEEEIHWEWGRKWLPDFIDSMTSVGQIEFLINALYSDFGVEKPLIPMNSV